MKPSRAREPVADAINELVGLGEGSGPVRGAAQFGLEQVFDREEDLAVLAMNIENGREGLAEIGFGDFHPDGVDVGAHQVAIAQVNPRRGDGAGDHAVGVFEVILVVGAATGAVGINQGGLAATTGTAAALGVVGRGGRDVAQVDDVKLGDVHAELHGRRTKEERQFRGAEAVFTFLAVLGSDLGGVLAGFQDAFEVNEAAIAFHEVLVYLGRYFAGIEQAGAIHGANLAGIGEPAEGIVVDLEARDVAAAHLFDDAVAFEGQEEEADAGVHLGAAKGFARRRVRQEGAPEITAETSEGGDEKPPAILLLFGARVSHDGFHQLNRVVEVPNGAFQQAGIGLLDEVALFLRVEDIGLHGKGAAQDVEQGTKKLVPEFRCAGAERRGRFDELLRLAIHARFEPALPEVGFTQQTIGAGEALILESQQAAVFEVGRGDAPAALEVTVKVVVNDAAEGVIGGIAGRPFDFRVGGIIVEPERQGFEHAAGEVAVREAGRAFGVGRLVQRGTNERDLGEVVEVSRLKRGVLTIIGEAEQLAGFGFQADVGLEFDEGADGEDSGRGAAVVNAERAEFGAFGTLALGVGYAAGWAEAEQEIVMDEGCRDPFVLGDDSASGIDEDRIGEIAMRFSPDSLHALGRGFLHEGGEPLEEFGSFHPRPRR